MFGNPAAGAASYDLGEVIKGKVIDNFGIGALDDQARNDGFVPYKEKKPWTEDKPYILWTAMVIIVFGLIFLGSEVIKKMDGKSR